MLISIEAQNAKQTPWETHLPLKLVWNVSLLNSLVPSVARQPWKIQPHLSLFSLMWHVQVSCLVSDDTCNNMRWRDWSRCWKMVPPNKTSRQPLASPRAWPGTGTWQLVATSDVQAKDAYDARPLAKTSTSAKWLYVTVTVLPENSKWTSCKPPDSKSVTKLCAPDSMRTASTADYQHVVPFSPRTP